MGIQYEKVFFDGLYLSEISYNISKGVKLIILAHNLDIKLVFFPSEFAGRSLFNELLYFFTGL